MWHIWWSTKNKNGCCWFVKNYGKIWKIVERFYTPDAAVLCTNWNRSMIRTNCSAIFSRSKHYINIIWPILWVISCNQMRKLLGNNIIKGKKVPIIYFMKRFIKHWLTFFFLSLKPTSIIHKRWFYQPHATRRLVMSIERVSKDRRHTDRLKAIHIRQMEKLSFLNHERRIGRNRHIDIELNEVSLSESLTVISTNP